MNHKTHHQTSPNRTSRNFVSTGSTGKNVRTSFNTSPDLSNFTNQKNTTNKKCHHKNKNEINASKRPMSAGKNPVNTANFTKPEPNQIIYRQCGHAVNSFVRDWIDNNTKYFPTGLNNNMQFLQKVPATNIYNKYFNANAQMPNINVKPINMGQKAIVVPSTKISELPKVQENINKPNKNTSQQTKTSETSNNQPVVPKINTKETNQSVNKTKNVKHVLPAEKRAQTPPNQKVTEIYKRKDATFKNTDLSVTGLQQANRLSFQKVTQDLANIIKNFQKQIHDVPLSNAIEQIPSAMLQPKIKEFFKSAPDNRNLTKNSTGSKTPPSSNGSKPQQTNNGNKSQQTNNGNKSQQISKNQQSSNTLENKSQEGNSNVNNKNSSKSLSFKTCTSKPNVRRFSSFTHHNLTVSGSTFTRTRGSSVSVDPLKQLKDEVQRAIRERKTFTIRGHYQPIRRALLARGWVEKYHPSHKDHVNEDIKRYMNLTISELLPLLRREDLTNTCKMLIKSKLLGGYQVDFYWGTNDEAFKENPDKIKYTIINKLKREIFSYTNKQGLCDASKSSYWYQKSNVSKLNHPRSYSLGKNGDLKGFIEDFHITAGMSLLKWVVKINSTRECKLISPTGQIPLEAFDFALNECCKFIKKKRHEDIDMQIPEAKELEWTKFLDYFYKLIHFSNHFKEEKTETEDSLVRKSNYILNNLRLLYPFVDMDGFMNIWILKPTASSRGRGIHMCRTLQYVLKVIKQNQNVRYIIQKYIERPLLIYNTKFDIRQWFLISNCSPLTIWMYKDSYLRFSSQTYNLRKLHESIHLTNNSVQCKYKNNSVDTALPSYNMWDSLEFQTYLTNIGYPNAFKDIIYPGMRQCITAAVLMHQEKMVVRKNCFELYGADFILTEDFQPWLLEINSNPALFASTPITARMCPKVLEDVIKVVIDYTHSTKASTGGFEMVYKEQPQKLPAPGSLELRGLPLRNSYFFNAMDEKLRNCPSMCNGTTTFMIEESKNSLKVFGEEIKKTLKDLLEIIHNEKQKRGLINPQNANVAARAVSVK